MHRLTMRLDELRPGDVLVKGPTYAPRYDRVRKVERLPHGSMRVDAGGTRILGDPAAVTDIQPRLSGRTS